MVAPKLAHAPKVGKLKRPMMQFLLRDFTKSEIRFCLRQLIGGLLRGLVRGGARKIRRAAVSAALDIAFAGDLADTEERQVLVVLIIALMLLPLSGDDPAPVPASRS